LGNFAELLVFNCRQMHLKFIVFILTLVVPALCSAQEIKEFKNFDPFADIYLQEEDNDSLHIINFWATWCKPCVKELPLFDSLKTENYEVTLVSLDFTLDAVESYVQRKKVQSEVVLLSDQNTNRWIDLVDPNWSGAIPFTIVKYKDKMLFFEKSYHSLQELKKDIQTIY
jgi:thiol-disulfide isomerase/thioredoxin